MHLEKLDIFPQKHNNSIAKYLIQIYLKNFKEKYVIEF